jgi:hypothetical protein
MSVMAIYRQPSGIMRGMRYRLAAVVVLGLVAFCCVSGRLNSQTQADWDWTNKEFGPVLDALMPLQTNGGLSVSYRANRDLVTSIPEYWFRIGYEFNEKQGYGLQSFFSAHVRIASPNSIYDQLMALHRSNPATQEAANFKSRIKLRSYDFTEMNCPAIKAQMDKFEKLQMKLPGLNGSVVTIHPMNHAFYAQGAEGDMSIVLTDEEHPLVKWALETRQELERCVK